MKKINLRELYPDVYTTDFLVDVTEEVMLKKTDIEPMVIEAIREIVRNEEYAQAIKKRIGVQIDTKAVDKELEGYQAIFRHRQMHRGHLPKNHRQPPPQQIQKMAPIRMRLVLQSNSPVWHFRLNPFQP